MFCEHFVVVHVFRLSKAVFTKEQKVPEIVNLWVNIKDQQRSVGFYNIYRHKIYDQNDTKDHTEKWKCTAVRFLHYT